MNKYEHSTQSAKIFGGDSAEYEAFHALIDSNKTVTPSIFGRFFLHHIDIGLPILESIFGKEIGSKKVSTKKLLVQHLLEDYDQVITFRNHWLPALESKSSVMPKPDKWDSFVERAAVDPRTEKINIINLKELENHFRLKILLPENSFSNDLIFSIFGHALGGDFLAKIIGKKFHGLWTSDVITGYLNCRFTFAERERDLVPTLIDYERYVPDLLWMHAPKRDEGKRFDVNRIKKMIDGYEKTPEIFSKPAGFRRATTSYPSGFSSRKSCNLD